MLKKPKIRKAADVVGKLGFGCVLVTVYSQAAGITCLGKYMLTTSFTLFLGHGKIIEEKF